MEGGKLEKVGNGEGVKARIQGEGEMEILCCAQNVKVSRGRRRAGWRGENQRRLVTGNDMNKATVFISYGYHNLEQADRAIGGNERFEF